MGTGDIRDDWRIQAIERRVDQAVARLYEVDTLRSTITGLEHTIRELSTNLVGLRSEFEWYKEEGRLKEEEIRQLIGEQSGK